MFGEQDAGTVVSHLLKISSGPLCVLAKRCSFHVMGCNTFVTAVFVFLWAKWELGEVILCCTFYYTEIILVRALD